MSDFLRSIKRLQFFLWRLRRSTKGAINAITNPKEAFKEAFDDLQRLHTLANKTDERILYSVVGQALTAWAKTEEAIVTVARILLGVSGEKAGLVMYSIINFNVWLSLVDELFDTEPQFQHFNPRWNKIVERIKRIKDDRDRLAHHAADPPDSTGGPSFERVTLRPSQFDARKKSKKFQPMDAEQILDFSEKTTAIARDLLELVRQMTDQLEAPKQKPGAQPSDQNPA